MQDDILLQELIRRDDRKAFEYLFNLYFIPLCRFGSLYLNDSHEIKQIALDVYTYLWETRKELHIKLSFKSYLFQAMKNRCLNALRDAKDMCDLESVSELGDKDNLDIEMDELNQLIQEAILALPDRCREVFVKSRKEHLSYKEIAEAMDISVKTVEVQIGKALKRIKDALGNDYHYLF